MARSSQGFSKSFISKWSKFCDLCQCSESAGWKCLNCSDVMCENCVRVHRNGKMSKCHVIIASSQKTKEENLLKKIRCDEHYEENNEMYCEQCEKPICKICIIEEHKSHPLMHFEIRAAQEKEKLRHFMKNDAQINLRLIQERIDQQMQNEADFREENENLTNYMDGRIQEVVLPIRDIQANATAENTSKMKGMRENCDLLRDMKSNVSRAISDVEDAVKRDTPIELITTIKDYYARLSPNIPEAMLCEVDVMSEDKLNKEILTTVRKECNSKNVEEDFGHLVERNARLLKKMEQMKKDHEKDLEAYHEKYNTLSDRKINMDREMNALRSQNLRLQQERDHLKAERDSVVDSAGSIRRELSQLHVQVESERLKLPSKSAVRRCMELQEEVERLRKDIEQIQTDNTCIVSALKKEIASLRKQNPEITKNEIVRARTGNNKY